MFNINEYYLGVILAHPDYFINPKRHRYYGDVSFDPFDETPPIYALTIGIVTLLHKVEEKYYDEYYSIYKNEIGYQLETTNNLGLTLAYVRPFQDYYKEQPQIYIQEEIEGNTKKLEELYDNHSYYVTHYKYSKDYAIVQLDTEPMKLVTRDYLNKQLENNGISYKKK